MLRPSIVLNAHLLSAQAGYRSAGIHGYIYNTLRHLPEVEPAYRYHVLVGEGQAPTHEHFTLHRSRFSTAQPIRRILWEQLMQPAVLRWLKPDLVHGMAFVLPLLSGVPAVVTVYDLSFIRFPQALSRTRRWYLQLFTRRSCQKARRVIAISDSTANDLVTLFGIPREKIVVAVPGVDERFKPLAAAEITAFRHDKCLPERFILHVGTLEPRKNLPMLLRAYAALPESLRREVHMVLAGGKGWDYEDVFATIETYDLAATVHLAGYVESSSLPLWYNAAEMVVCPSLFEGWGLPVVEAMACGRPTVVSDISSLPEAVGEAGKRLPPNDQAAWTDALYHALTDAEWRERSAQDGIQRAKQFTWRQTAEKTVEAYRAALATGSAWQ